MKLKQYLDEKFSKISLYTIGTAVIIFILCTILSLSGGFFRKLFNVIGLVLKPIIYGGIIAYLFEPLIQKLEKLIRGKAARPAAVLITGILIIAVIAGGIILIAAGIQKQSNTVDINFTDIGSMIGTLGIQLSEVNEKVQQWLSENTGVVGESFKRITEIFGSLSDIGSSILFSVIFAVYFLLDSKNIGAYWDRVLDIFIKPDSRGKAREFIREADRCFSGYIRGKVLDALIVFAMCGTAMLICRIPHAFAIGLMTALGNLIPFVGPIGGLIALLVICLSEGLMNRFLISAIVLIVLMTIDANVINPKLMSRSIAIHPLLVFAAMIAGGAVGGIAGMLVSAPIAALLKIEFDKYIEKKEKDAA